MVEDHQRLLVFHSLHRVMLAEKRLQVQYAVLLIPVPRSISADCGMALRFEAADQALIVQQLREAGLKPFELYVPTGDDNFVLLQTF
ncbi:MAG: DUF3343 domain-containing protein [Desulfuromonadaceae bacterium]|nr:DUF3343 domain-containing protein [Desulfuromonadaceae bacterium]